MALWTGLAVCTHLSYTAVIQFLLTDVHCQGPLLYRPAATQRAAQALQDLENKLNTEMSSGESYDGSFQNLFAACLFVYLSCLIL